MKVIDVKPSAIKAVEIKPITSKVVDVKPTNLAAQDDSYIYDPRVLSAGQSIGPGLLMIYTYPESITLSGR